MAVLYANNARSTLAASITASQTSLTVAAGDGALFPAPTGSDVFYATLTDINESIREIVRVTARSADTLTVVRGQDGTSAQSWAADTKVELRLTKAMLDDFKTDARSGLLSGNQTVTLSGDVSGSGTTSITATLANSGVSAGTYPKVTVDAKGRVTSGSSLASGDLPTYGGTLTSSQVTTALGYTPYNNTNPSGYISGINAANVTAALGFTPYNSTNPSGYVTSSGSGASGTWGINITGSAASAGSVSGLTLNNSANGINPDSVTQNQIGYNTSVSLYGQTDGGLYSSAYSGSWIHQIFGDFRSGQIAVRGKNNGTWQAWRAVLDASNYTSYSPSLTGSGASGTWGINVTGSANTVTNLNGAITILSGGGGATFSSNHYSIGKDIANGSWSHPHYSDLIIGYHTGIRIGAGYSGIRFYNNSPTTDANNDGNGDGGESLLMTIGGHAGGSDVIINNNLQLSNGNLKLGQGDGTALRVTTAYGWLNLGAQNSSWAHMYSNLNFYFNNGIWIAGNRVLDAGNYTSYAPSLTGGGASGTWGINVTGSAATATTLLTSRAINGVSFNGSADIAVTEWFHSGRDFPNGTLITTSINYGVDYGDPWVLEIKGNSYGFQIPFDIQLQGYIYAGSMINYGGYSNGTNITGMVALNVGGNLCFWFPYQAYWNGYNVRAYVAYPTYATNRVLSISNAAKPSGSKEVALSAYIRQSLHSGNYTSYAPSLTGSGASGTWGISITGSAGTAGFATNAGIAQTAAFATRADVANYAYSAGALSDERLKKDWTPIDSGFVQQLATLRAGTYTRIDTDKREAGVSAQSVREILPEAVEENDDGMLLLAYGNAALVSAVELAKDNVQLRARIERLEAIVATLLGESR